MNFKERESPTKLRGGYYTEPDIARFLCRWALGVRPRTLLEPSCGDGVFFDALASLAPESLESVIACELDPDEAALATSKRSSLNGTELRVLNADFLEWSIEKLRQGFEVDAVVGNPPFIRYQYLDRASQERAATIFEQHRLRFTRHTNAWVPFVVASVALLRPGGRLAMVVPAELLHVLHAQSLRDFLLGKCSRILVLDPETLWFEKTLQGVVLLLVEKAKQPNATSRLAVLAAPDREVLARSPRTVFRDASYANAELLNGKWMTALLSEEEQALLARARAHDLVDPFGDVASADVGIVTGANKFFLVDDETVARYALEQWAHPMYGRSEQVSGVIYDEWQHEENRREGQRTNFIDFRSPLSEPLSESALEYIELGEAEGLHTRYKCRIRSPWYEVPSVYVAPVGMLKRCHHLPRLVLNRAEVLTTDTAYRIVPREVEAEQLVASFVNSLTALSAELEGRHYGGGVLELVPSEIERLLIPRSAPKAGTLRRLDEMTKAGEAPERVLAAQDRELLAPLGFSPRETERLRHAWARLRSRRHRVPPRSGD